MTPCAKTKKATPLRFLWLLPALSLAAAILFLLATGLPYNKVHGIEDAAYVQQLSHQAVPESVTLLDPVWGSITVEQPEKVLACYNLLTRLPSLETEAGGSGRIRGRELSGTINFLDRSNIHFSIFDSVVVDGITYSGTAVRPEASLLVQELCEGFYTPESLSRLVDRYTRIVLRTDAARTNLSTTTKHDLKQELMACVLLGGDQLSAALQRRGQALCQIEIYTDDSRPESGERQTPQVYLSVYGNGLCIVNDVDNSIGSDMHLMGDLPSIFALLENETPRPAA